MGEDKIKKVWGSRKATILWVDMAKSDALIQVLNGICIFLVMVYDT